VHTGFDPACAGTPYRWFRISPRRIQSKLVRSSQATPMETAKAAPA
jgi:hypothetical protein